MLTRRDAVVGLAASVATLLVAHVVHMHYNEQPPYQTTLGRAKAVGERAFVLSVGLQFQDNSSAELLLRAWEKAAAYCIANEPFLFAYEVAQSDQGEDSLRAGDTLFTPLITCCERPRLAHASMLLVRCPQIPCDTSSSRDTAARRTILARIDVARPLRPSDRRCARCKTAARCRSLGRATESWASASPDGRSTQRVRLLGLLQVVPCSTVDYRARRGVSAVCVVVRCDVSRDPP